MHICIGQFAYEVCKYAVVAMQHGTELERSCLFRMHHISIVELM